MCGFFVAYDPAAGVEQVRLQAAARAIRHRGPDGQTIWTSPAGIVGMAFNRLAIVGPAHETQPFYDAGRQVVAVVNGEIYSHEAQRTGLKTRGARFTTRSDCEVVLHAYLEQGWRFVRELNGEYAFVIWDGRNRELLAGRDRFGVKPLYYRANGQALTFASEIKAMLAADGAARWDAESLHQHVLAALAPGRTLFDGIRQLEPGHVLRAGDDGVHVEKYWDIAYSTSAPPDSADDLAEELRSALHAAVKDRLQGEHSVATYLSGGIDSAAITSLAADNAADVQSFSVDFGGEGSEIRHARDVAAAIGVRHHVIEVREQDFVDHFEDAAWNAETIGFNAIGVAKWLLSRFASSHGYKVVLNGDGADELFAGYAFSAGDAMLARFPDRAASLIELLGRSQGAFRARIGLPLNPYPVPAHWFADALPPLLLTNWSYGRCIFRELFAPEFKATFAADNPFAKLVVALDATPLRELGGLRKSLYLWQKTLFVSHILAAERLDMAHGIEGRLPFLDNRVVDVAQKVPDHLLVSGGTEKYLLRQAMRSVVPDTTRARAKRPFQAPCLTTRGNRRFVQYMFDELLGQGMRECGIFDSTALRRLLDHWETLPDEGQQQLDPVMMILLSTNALRKRFDLTLN